MALLKRSLTRGTAAHPADPAVSALVGPLEAARRRGARSALFLVDLNNFHVLNNGLGRAFGDAVLGLVAKRLEMTVQNLGLALPCGGDRFMVLVSQVGQAASIDPAAMAARLLNTVRMPIHVQGEDEPPVVVSASIGSVLDGGASADELLRCADIALHEAKARGLRSHVNFEPAMRDAAEAEARLERELREALDTERLFLAYLPSIDIASGRVTGAEALLRWQHPERGIVAARDFVPLLEQSGTIIDIGSWVLQEACMQAAAWQRRFARVTIHVNLSPRQLRADVLIGDLRDALETSHLDPSLLVLEVAESTIVADTATVTERIAEFKALGVQIAVDNFGAAYATLSQLQRLSVDSVKIDRALIADIGKEETGTSMLRTLVEIADGLGLQTIAQGVEDDVQLKELRDAGCSEAVGYLFSEPLDADALDKLFEDAEMLAPAARSGPPGASTVGTDKAADLS
ncbi:MAG TPA: GGDEF domain-containing phosphodiesterase [Acidimicrobiales bacterium]|nr:GGDEF domain-containing phosphodiesterase [Acidimicrobiales bacterium]